MVKKTIIVLMMTCLPIIAFAQGVGGQVRRPVKKQQTSDPRNKQNVQKRQPAKVSNGIKKEQQHQQLKLKKEPKVKEEENQIIEKTIYFDGMTFSVKGEDASLIKGKDQEFIVISGLIEDQFGKYKVHTIEKEAFRRLKKIRHVTIADGIVEIKSDAFTGCSNLQSVYLGNTLEIIGSYAFYNCKIEQIQLPNSLRIIHESAFNENYISTIQIPANVEQIQGNPFCSYLYRESKLANISIDNSNKKYYCPLNGNIIIDRNNKSVVIGCNNSIIPSGIKTIGDHAFAGCTMKSFEIPEGVERIGKGAFWCCKSLNNLTFPSTIKFIEEHAFGHLAITSIVFPDNTKEIGWDSFGYCKNLRSVFIPATIEQIGDHPFGDCPNLSEIRIHKDNQYYDSRNNCNAIIEKKTNRLVNGCKNTIIPFGITKIDGWAFHGHKGLLSIEIPETVKSIGMYAFTGTGLTTVKVPQGCEIEDNAFDDKIIIITN